MNVDETDIRVAFAVRDNDVIVISTLGLVTEWGDETSERMILVLEYDNCIPKIMGKSKLRSSRSLSTLHEQAVLEFWDLHYRSLILQKPHKT